ncbi:MAG: transporter substrate-binding domain-containing protein [Oscillospiraceae bacterium]
MKLNKLLPLSLALVLSLSLAACGPKAPAETPTPPADPSVSLEPSAEPTPEADGSLQRVLDAGKLSIGAEGNWIPYVFNKDGTGELTGFEVDIATEICTRLGVEPDFQIANSWDPVIAGLDASRCDAVICGVNPKPERQEKYSLSIPYAENPFCVVVAADNEDIKTFADLNGKLCANSLTSTAGDLARKAGAELSDASLTAAMDLITTGRADATVNNVAAVEEYMKERPEVKIKIAALYEPAADEGYIIQSSAMFRKTDVSLCDKVSEIIKEMIADGTCYDLTVKYFGQTVADSTTIYKK